MRLTRKLIFAIAIGIACIFVINSSQRVGLDVARFEADSRADHLVLARALAAAIELLADKGEELQIHQVVDAVNARETEMTVHWVQDLQARAPTGPMYGSVHWPLSPKERSEIRRPAKGAPLLITRAPVRLEGHPPSIIEVSEELTAETGISSYVYRRTLINYSKIFAYCLAVLAVFGTLFVGRPLRELTAQARSIGQGDLTKRLHFRQNDEIRELAEEMNAMSDKLLAANNSIAVEANARISAVEQLRHADRLRTVGEIASGIAHELGTPLNVVRARGAMIASGEASETRARELGAVIVEQTDRMAGIIRQLLDFSRRDPVRKEKIDLKSWLPPAAALIEPLAQKANVALSVNAPTAPTVIHADSNLLRQALSNLIVNAIQATPENGDVHVTVGAERVVSPRGRAGAEIDVVSIHVRDSGGGVPQGQLERIFEPFFTTKGVGTGTGLGLAVTQEIIHEHDGWITVSSDEGKGAEFVVWLPRAAV